MKDTNTGRIDEVSQYYKPAEMIGKLILTFFWINAAISFIVPYSVNIFGKEMSKTIQIFFTISVLIYFIASQVSSLYLVPRAEVMRRTQLLSNSFGVPLSQDNTVLYYNNSFSPSVQRLAANTMENSLFSKEIILSMLHRKRVIIIAYTLAWLFAISFRQNNLELVTWITQLIFSNEIFSEWLKLEFLKLRCEKVYDDLYFYFFHKIEKGSPSSNANLIGIFTAYESAKSTAGLILSSNDFNKLNPSITKKWEGVRQQLNMQEEAI
jgi:hypothetical protein